MSVQPSIPWPEIYDFVLECGHIRDPKDFSLHIINKIGALVPFDQARLYFVNDNGTVYDEFLVGIDKKWVREYHEYYSQLENGRYSIFGKAMKNGHYSYVQRADARVREWQNCEPDEFVTNYVKQLGLKYSFGFNLHDVHNSVKSIFVLDRITDIKYSKDELDVVALALNQLENLHRNLFVQPPKENNAISQLKEDVPLTAREAEIAELLKSGVSPNNISQKLCISQTTVYKHIAHIHEKLHISNRQELMVKLLAK